MLKKYETEMEGQLEFYSDYLQLIDNALELEDIIMDNNDGVLRGNLIEFKLNINDLSSVLFQAVKYLSARRIKGKPVPSNIVIIALNSRIAYIYNSIDYLEDIEQVYMGASSKENVGFKSGSPFKILKYGENNTDELDLIETLRSDNFTKINIDENNVVGWATNYYSSNPNARKSDFIGDLKGKVKIIGEIRNPNFFKKYIHPYNHETNIKFEYLMDRLNDDIQKKNLGAFYTNNLYAKKSVELVRQAIARVPEGNEYIILDRCAGTGNLQQHLSDEELSHTIVSTIEYYEYKVLLELLGDKVKYIIPPTEKEDTFNMGLVRGADALSEEYINNDVIKKYIDDPKCTIILFENPPYAEVNGVTRTNQGALWKSSYAVTEMKKEVGGNKTNDLGSIFIWSAFKYYLRQPTDSYIVYSPVKYWKAQHLIDKKFLGGFAFNRRHFHTKINACIMAALWSNEDADIKSFNLQAFDIEEGKLIDEGELSIDRIYSTYSKEYYDRRRFTEDNLGGIAVDLNGEESNKTDKQIRVKKILNDNIVGYLVANMSGFDNPDLNSGLTVTGRYDGNGFFLRKDNYLEKLPMFAGSRYITYNRYWTERARVMKSSDGVDKYNVDIENGKLNQFLLKTLLFTTLETQNHMRTFTASNGVFYRNELCLDNTDGCTIATKDLGELMIEEKEEALLNQWNAILRAAKNTKNYDKSLTYGVYQIQEELNTFEIIRNKNKNERKYDYPELNGYLSTLKTLVKDYYLSEIVPTLFDYEFLK